jgi:hypothetical protein
MAGASPAMTLEKFVMRGLDPRIWHSLGALDLVIPAKAGIQLAIFQPPEAGPGLSSG